MKSPISLALLASLAACSSRPLTIRRSPEEALNEAAARLTERGVALDPGARRADRLRTGYFCHRPGEPWDTTLTSPATAPVGYELEGTLEEQATTRARCPLLVQVEVTALKSEPPATSEARLEVQTAWWRLKERRCAPKGDPLLGVLSCEVAYEGATGEPGLERFVYGILAGI